MGEVLEHKKASNAFESNYAQIKLSTLEKQVWCFTRSEGNSFRPICSFFLKNRRKERVYTIHFGVLFEKDLFSSQCGRSTSSTRRA